MIADLNKKIKKMYKLHRLLLEFKHEIAIGNPTEKDFEKLSKLENEFYETKNEVDEMIIELKNKGLL